MKRGEVWWADLEPAQGSESKKMRPVVLVSRASASNAAARRGRGVVTVVPLTSNTETVYSMQVLIDAQGAGLSKDSKAQAEQVRSIDVRRLQHQVGQLGANYMKAIDAALRLHLDL